MRKASPRKHPFQVRIDRSLEVPLKAAARENRRSLTQQIHVILSLWKTQK